jgi:kumamolisin
MSMITSFSSPEFELASSHRDPVENAERVRDVDPSEMVDVTVYIRRNPKSGPAPDPMVEAQKHPHDRRYLDPAEIEQAFGADAQELQAVVRYAESVGLEASDFSLATRSVRLRGSARQLSSAFGVELGVFSLGTRTWRGRVGKIKVPNELAEIVEAVFGFDNRRVGRHYLHPGGQSLAVAADGSLNLPANTYFPPQVAQMYGFPSAYDATGETIAVFAFNGDIGGGQSAPGGYVAGDISQYLSTTVGITNPPVPTDVVIEGPGNDPGDGSDPNDASGEVYLDLSIVGSLASGAKVAVYFTQFTEQGWVDAVNKAATDAVNDPSVISISYGNPENDPQGAWTQAGVDQVNKAFQAAAAAGRTICCASGDDGAPDEPNSTVDRVDFPASSPWVLACGGTRLESAGGVISNESVWNDLSAGHGATGGGVSAIFPKPAWQAATSAAPMPGVTPPANGRGVPDVSSLADPETPFAVAQPGGQVQGVGGTSAAAPLWSSLVGRLNQALGTRCGYLNPLLYQKLSGDLRDITVGDNGGYKAHAGWDACTGWGSPGANTLLTGLQSAGAAAPPPAG